MRLRSRAAQERLALPDELAERLLAYFAILTRWNRKINLTSLADPEQAIDRLLLEPLAAARLLPHDSRLVDLGSGGGSPAIPLALALRASEVLMIESRSRKASFLREAARAVQLDATVEASRFEDICRLTAYAGRFDVASVRAVRQDVATLRALGALLRIGGVAGLFVGPGGLTSPEIPPDLAWRGTEPLLRSTGSQLALLFHVEQ